MPVVIKIFAQRLQMFLKLFALPGLRFLKTMPAHLLSDLLHLILRKRLLVEFRTVIVLATRMSRRIGFNEGSARRRAGLGVTLGVLEPDRVGVDGSTVDLP